MWLARVPEWSKVCILFCQNFFQGEARKFAYGLTFKPLKTTALGYLEKMNMAFK
jgi:hypothetical protein